MIVYTIKKRSVRPKNEIQSQQRHRIAVAYFWFPRVESKLMRIDRQTSPQRQAEPPSATKHQQASAWPYPIGQHHIGERIGDDRVDLGSLSNSLISARQHGTPTASTIWMNLRKLRRREEELQRSGNFQSHAFDKWLQEFRFVVVRQVVPPFTAAPPLQRSCHTIWQYLGVNWLHRRGLLSNARVADCCAGRSDSLRSHNINQRDDLPLPPSGSCFSINSKDA